ncbi:MAG: hypothetical protein JWN93_3985 [Hyphomicrobiales bacterium]|nr:hypothetical protein [Hyphomicrobiales bacterium]
MPDVQPQVESSASDGAAILTLRGDWIARHSSALERLAAWRPQAASSLRVDVSRIDSLDTYGAWSIESIRRAASQSGAPAEIVGVRDRHASILRSLGRIDLAPAPPARATVVDPLARTGDALLAALDYLLALASLLGRLVISFMQVLAHPSRLRWISVVHHIDRVGLRAVPIIALMTFLIGCIIAQQGFFHFRRFGASDYVVDLVTILVLREIGVLLVTIMIAGRSGSAYTAEVGSMKMREEIDALRTMGLDPVDILILPRVLAITIAAPMLTLLGMMAAMVGAGFVAATYGDMSAAIYMERLREAATSNDFQVGMIKAPVMALIIGTVAALEGLRVQGSAESLGLGATSSVVKSIFLVIVLDGVFAIIFAWVGM